MTTEEEIIKNKLGLLQLAEELENVSQACRIMGYSRDSFYRFRDHFAKHGAEGLREISRQKPTPKYRVTPEVEEAVVQITIDYPDRFGCRQDARGWIRPFFQSYNHQHYHTGLNLLPPASVYYGQSEPIRQQQHAVLAAAYAQHPQHFVRGEPIAKGAPDAVWINPPLVPNLP
ncbi:helix-turn-helix domain-containing protein [Chloroflexota bacterium]